MTARIVAIVGWLGICASLMASGTAAAVDGKVLKAATICQSAESVRNDPAGKLPPPRWRSRLLSIADDDMRRGNFSGALKAYGEAGYDAPSLHTLLGVALAWANMHYHDAPFDDVYRTRLKSYRRAIDVYCHALTEPTGAAEQFPFWEMLKEQVADFHGFLAAPMTPRTDADMAIVGRQTRIKAAPRMEAATVERLKQPVLANIMPVADKPEWVRIYWSGVFLGYAKANRIKAVQ